MGLAHERVAEHADSDLVALAWFRARHAAILRTGARQCPVGDLGRPGVPHALRRPGRL